MEKYGSITKDEMAKLEKNLNNYYKKNANSLHPTFIDGANYIMKHLKIL